MSPFPAGYYTEWAEAKYLASPCASYEFWNTDNHALVKRAFAEDFADGARQLDERTMVGLGPNGRMAPEKESIMIALSMISEKLNAWRRYREAVRELSQFSDRELCDIGIRRCDIEDIVRRTGPRKQDV